jgi:hypothetical protein
MKRRELPTAGVATGLAAGALPTRANSTENHETVVGSWLATITAPGFGQFNDLISFHPGGIVTESRRYAVDSPYGRLLETTGHGAWERHDDAYKVFFRFFLQDPTTGAPVGTDNIRLSIELDRSTGALTGTFQSQVKDVNDNVLMAVTGPWTATRITV